MGVYAIDMGHTLKGAGTGAVGFLNETDVNRAVGKRLISMLKEAGHTVHDCTVDVSNNDLADRVRKANATNAEFFLSIHLNAFSSESANGTEIYVYPSASTTTRTKAKAINDAVVNAIKTTNRGVKEATYYVLKNTKMPAALVELFFITNQADCNKYDVEKLAKALFIGLTGKVYNGCSNTSSNTSTSSSTASKTSNFINKLAPLAVEDYKTSKVLPSLTIAQAVLESGWGESELAVKANNLFGIKADSRWTGKIYNTETKEYYNNSNIPTAINANFRSYDSWEGGVKDHSEFLQADRYSKVINAKDYKTACEEVYKAGYATDPNYTSKLIKLIEDYNLHQYDTANTSSSTSSTTSELYRVRKDWNDASSQKGAYSVLDNAIAEAKKYSGYKVFNSAGVQVYPEATNSTNTTTLVKSYKENGKATVTGASQLNVRSSYKLENSEVVAKYNKNESFVYDEVYITSYKNIQYVWCSYIASSGLRRYVCAKEGNTRYLTCI